MLDAAARILDRPRWRWALIVGMAAGALAYLSYWAGVPRQGAAAFVIGIVGLVGVTIACGFGAWLLLLRAPPEGTTSVAVIIYMIATAIPPGHFF